MMKNFLKIFYYLNRKKHMIIGGKRQVLKQKHGVYVIINQVNTKL